MQTKAGSADGEEAAQAEAHTASGALEAGSVTQQDQGLLDEMEKLLEENDDLKVRHPRLIFWINVVDLSIGANVICFQHNLFRHAELVQS